MKTVKIIMVVAVMVVLTGCGTALQTAVVAVDIAGKTHDVINVLPDRKSNPDLILGKVQETYTVADYTVKVFDARLNKEPLIFFIAYKGGRHEDSIYFEKKNPDDMKMLNDFNQLGEKGKKRQIREWFIKYTKLDLGPVEPEATEKTSAPAPSSPLNIPTPGFAPTLPAQPR